MTKIQAQGIHPVTFVGSNREAAIEFYQDFLGLPLVFEQPNRDAPDEPHLYFDRGDGQLLEMAGFKFTPPPGHTLADGLRLAHRLRVEAGDYAIGDSHLADVLALLSEQPAPAGVPAPSA